MKYILCLFLIFIFIFKSPVLSQKIWNRVQLGDHEFSVNIEDVGLLENGNIYVCIQGRDLVYESKDEGISWTLLPSNTRDAFLKGPFKFNQFDQNREIIPIKNDSFIIQEHIWGGFWIQSLRNGVLTPDSLYINKPGFWPKNRIRYDDQDNIFVFAYNDYLYKARNYGSNVFDRHQFSDKIWECFIYDDTLSYFIASPLNRRYIFYRFDGQNTTEMLYVLSTLAEPFTMKRVHVSRTGNIFVGEDRGLFVKYANSTELKLAQFSPESHIKNGFVEYIGLSEDRQSIITKIEDQVIMSYDEGETWIKPAKINTDLPELHNGIKVHAIDSNFIILDGSESECGARQLYIYSSVNGGWTIFNPEIEAYDVIDLSGVKENGNIFAKLNQSCGSYVSGDEGESWDKFLIHDTLGVRAVWNSVGQELLAIADDGKLYVSENGGLSWSKSTIPEPYGRTKIISVYHLYDNVYFMTTRHKYSTQTCEDIFTYRSLDNGHSWALMEYESLY